MSLLEKIPSLDDTSLKNLLENARRLEVSGSERQKADAAELLPALEAAFAQRRAVKLEAAAAKRATTRKAPVAKKPAVAKAG
jgi:hypothetical protein